MSKRKFPQTSGGSSKKFKAPPVAPDLQGILVSCNNSRMRESETELFPLLEEVCDQIYGKAPQSSSESDSISSGLLAELAELQDAKKNPSRKKFQRLDFVVKAGKLFDSPDKSIDPSALVLNILNDVLQTKQARTKYTVKLLPVQATCYSSLESIEATLRPLLTAALTDEPASFSVQYKCRAHDTMDRMSIINSVAAMVQSITGKKITVDLKKPDLAIFIEITARVTCLSLVRNFNALGKMSIYTILGIQDPEHGMKKRAAALEAAASASSAAASTASTAASAAAVDAEDDVEDDAREEDEEKQPVEVESVECANE